MDAEWDDLSLTDSQWDTVFASVDAASTADQHYENNNQTMDVEWDDLSLTDSQLDTVFAAADAAEDQQYNDVNDSVCVDDDDDNDDDDDDEDKVVNRDQLRQTTAKPKKQYIRLRKNLVLVKTAWDFPWEEETNSSEENGTVGSTSTLTGSSRSSCNSSSSYNSHSSCNSSNSYNSDSSDSHSSHDSDSTDSHYSDSSSSQSEDIYSCNSDHSHITESHSYIPHSPSNIQDTQPFIQFFCPHEYQEFNTKWQALLLNNHPPSTQSSSPSSHPTRQIGGGSTDDLPSEDSPSDEDSGAKYYSIIRVRERQVKKFNATAHDYEIQFNDIQTGAWLRASDGSTTRCV
ncbi:dentin sialophosphoprotein-like [Ptychodera flava]|uniref:dentin sialophosphoprotein-like n=1 Tax=Ptychodera flava TaxID=63121 RepID=UPI003969EF56